MLGFVLLHIIIIINKSKRLVRTERGGENEKKCEKS